MRGHILEKVGGLEAVGLIFGFEKFPGEGLLPVFPKVGRSNSAALVIGCGLGEEPMFLLGDGGHIHIGTAVEKTVVASDARPQIGLQKEDRFFEPQRFGVVDGGFGANEKTGFVVLLDGVSPEPVFDAGVIVVESPEGLGC